MTDNIITPMTTEEVRKYAEEIERTANNLGIICGFKSHEEMDNFRIEASQGMIKFGGSFTYHLGWALAHADPKNTARIILTFRSICDEHAALYRKFLRENTKQRADPQTNPQKDPSVIPSDRTEEHGLSKTFYEDH